MTNSPTTTAMTMGVAPDATFLLDSKAATSSDLNPNADEFVPSWQVSGREAEQIDNIMRTVHHFATVNDTETLGEAERWLGDDPANWIENGAEYLAEGDYGSFMYVLDREDALRQSLYHAPHKPKGDTSGRARSHGKDHRWGRVA